MTKLNIRLPKDYLNDLRHCIQMAVVNEHKTYYSSCIIWKPQKWQNISLLKKSMTLLVSQGEYRCYLLNPSENYNIDMILKVS